jgi:hypothetical protein
LFFGGAAQLGWQGAAGLAAARPKNKKKAVQF